MGYGHGISDAIIDNKDIHDVRWQKEYCDLNWLINKCKKKGERYEM